jgi:acyl-CoA synthetase (AMP-forming)/AMP-acid ligase II
MASRTDPLRPTDPAAELEDLPATVPAAMRLRRRNGADPFVVDLGSRLTFAEADARSAELAGRLLAGGIGKGTRVGLLFANGAAWAVTWLALARIGALTVPLSTFSPGAELGRMVRQTDIHAILMSAHFGAEAMTTRLESGLSGLAGSPADLQLEDAPFLRWVHVTTAQPPGWSRALGPPLAPALVRAAESEVTPADALAIINTSGATAAPKSVVHTQGSLVRHAALLAQRRGLTSEDRIYSPMPFFWVGGLTMVLLAALVSGATAVTQERFEPGEALDLIERERVTQVSCWPNAARQIADDPTFAERDLRSVRGGTLVEALPPEHRPPSADSAPNVLGMTETGGPHTGSDDSYAPLPASLRGTMGRPLPGMEHVVIDVEDGMELPAGEEGELLLRGAFLMDGFYKRERHETFTRDGWYGTGDLGWFGADGHLRFTGRRTAMIKTGGSNVSPAEVEAALVQLPEVREAFVFGIPAGERGEDVAAVVVPEGPDPLEPPALTSSLRTVLSSYKIPRHLRIIEEKQLPKLPTGKIDVTSLRGLFPEA